MKNLVGYVPDKWLEKEKQGEREEAMVLENKNNVRPTQKEHSSASQDKFLIFVFKCSREKN